MNDNARNWIIRQKNVDFCWLKYFKGCTLCTDATVTYTTYTYIGKTEQWIVLKHERRVMKVIILLQHKSHVSTLNVNIHIFNGFRRIKLCFIVKTELVFVSSVIIINSDVNIFVFLYDIVWSIFEIRLYKFSMARQTQWK